MPRAPSFDLLRCSGAKHFREVGQVPEGLTAGIGVLLIVASDKIQATTKSHDQSRTVLFTMLHVEKGEEPFP